MREVKLANTTHRSRLSARLRLSAVTALCLTFGAGAAFAGSTDSLVAEIPAATDSAAGQFMSAPVEAPVSQSIRELVARSDSLPAPASFEEVTHLREFYAARNYEPLWVQGPGALGKTEMLLAALRQFELRSPANLAPVITAIDLRRSSWAPAQVAELDWALSLALLRGAVDPSDPLATGPHANALGAVATAKNQMLAFGQWLPRDPGFWQLRAAVGEYQKIADTGGWPVGITGKAKEEFALGERSEQIALLRQRLTVTGDYAAPAFVAVPVDPATIDPTDVEPAAGTPDLMVMDQALIDGIMQFQARHGLFADGVVGKNTLDALNVPVEARLRTMLINLRRLQLANRDYGSDYVMVNIAGQQMTLVQNGRITLSSDVIVGRDDRRTPEVDSAITRIEF
ncbi:MAG TPA: peptidoglycan-binding protein, partial [Dongiaceae bacterium]